MSDLVLLGDIPERNAARLGPDCWAVRHGDDMLTWGELADRVRRRAHALAAQDVKQDDLVVLALPNSNALFEWTFALWKLGATPAVVSARLPLPELLAVIETAEARFVVAQDVEIAGALPADFGRDHPDNGPLESKVAKHWKAMTSGGSTGRPKMIVDAAPSAMPEAALKGSVLRVPEDGVMLNPAPLYHNFPFAMTHMAMLNGSSVVGMTKFEPEELLRLIQAHGAQWVNLVPTMMSRVARLPAEVRARYDLSSLQTLWHTAAPIPPWLKLFWIDWIGPERVWEMYGGTEGFATTQLDGAEWLAHRGSVGRSQSEILIRGEDGRALPPGEVGEIFLRGANAGPTYQYRGADSRRTDDGFESFGDYGWLDADGYLYIADRRTDLILSGGSNIYPAEIEAVLMEHPQVDTAIVIGLPDEDLGQVPHAIVQPEAGQSPGADELRDFAAARLVRYKVPRSFEFTAEALRDEAGKVRRSRLLAERVKG